MADQKLDTYTTSDLPPEKHTRRDALKIGGSMVGAVAVTRIAKETGKFAFASASQPQPTEDPTPSKEKVQTTEVQKMIDEIVTYRKMLGLEGLPKNLLDRISSNEQWESPAEPFKSSLPEKNTSYALHTSEVMQAMYGPNATRLVKGAKADPSFPSGMSFDPGQRYCNIADDVHGIPIKDFTDYVLHEAAGHGSDPDLHLKMPSDILLRVEHGKWRALS